MPGGKHWPGTLMTKPFAHPHLQLSAECARMVSSEVKAPRLMSRAVARSSRRRRTRLGKVMLTRSMLSSNTAGSSSTTPRLQPSYPGSARACAKGEGGDAIDGNCRAGSAPRHEQTRAGAQDLSLSASRRGDYGAQSCLGG